MNTSLVVYIINFFSLVISVAQLCVASSLFDFIVMHKMYYTSHDQTVLIDPSYAVLFFTAPLLSTALSMLTSFLARHPFLTAVVHALLLGLSSAAFAFCSLTAAQMSLSIGYYAYNGVPQKFQDASFWYFMRIRAATVLFGMQSIFSLAQIALLYMGIECRYRAIAPNPKAMKDISGPLITTH